MNGFEILTSGLLNVPIIELFISKFSEAKNSTNYNTIFQNNFVSENTSRNKRIAKFHLLRINVCMKDYSVTWSK